MQTKIGRNGQKLYYVDLGDKRTWVTIPEPTAEVLERAEVAETQASAMRARMWDEQVAEMTHDQGLARKASDGYIR